MPDTVHRRSMFSTGPDMTVRRQRFHDLFTVRDKCVTLTGGGCVTP